MIPQLSGVARGGQGGPVAQPWKFGRKGEGRKKVREREKKENCERGGGNLPF